jgi:hypothetical protein
VGLQALRRDVERPCWNDPVEQAKHERCTCSEPSGMCHIHGYLWKRMYGVLRGYPPYAIKNPTHSWKLSEEAGILRMYDVKRLR